MNGIVVLYVDNYYHCIAMVKHVRRIQNEAMHYMWMLHFHFTLRWSQYDSMCALCSIKEHQDKEEGREFEVQ